MNITYIVILGIFSVVLFFSFALWAGGKVQDRYKNALSNHIIKYDKRYSVYKKNDPYQFLYRALLPTKLIISESELFIVGIGRLSSFFTHVLGISNVIKLSEISLNKVSDVIELKFKDEGGFYSEICLAGEDNEIIFGHLSS